LHLWGPSEIRANSGEVAFLTIAAAAWLLLATKLFSWLGLSFHDDVVERKNVAALVALCGALIALALIYAGGSIGEGPSYLNNVFSAGLGTVGMIALWVMLELGAKVSLSITEERDLASGLRLAVLLLATGLVLGRAVAGDWHSEEATFRDFIRDGWPTIILWGMALLIERFARPSRRRPLPPWPIFGLVPALLYLTIAGAWLLHLGAWEGIPK
jgi:uncharacterized membrane protein YjfL (UPF0719 family)